MRAAAASHGIDAITRICAARAEGAVLLPDEA